MKKKNKTHRRAGAIMNRSDIPFAKRMAMQHNSAIVANREHSAQVTMFCMCGALHKVHGIGFKIIDGKVSAFMDDDDNVVTYKEAVKKGILDNHEKVRI